VAWDPAQYLKFGDQRLRPAIDLLSRIDLDGPRRIYDLGAGAGNVTRLIKARWPEAEVVGVDQSAEMLAKAASDGDEISWQQADLGSWQADGAADLIYSNAALHWLGDHETLFPGLLSSIAPGGVLAVQMPRNFLAPSHALVADAARSGPWRGKLEPLLKPPPVQEPTFYFDLLTPAAANLDIWETEYQHILEGDDPVKEWLKGTWLIPFIEACEPQHRADFEAAYARLVADAYPKRPDGRTVFPFRRLFIVARRG